MPRNDSSPRLRLTDTTKGSITFDGRELEDREKGPVLAAYVDRWRWEVGQFFAELPKSPSADDLAAI